MTSSIVRARRSWALAHTATSVAPARHSVKKGNEILFFMIFDSSVERSFAEGCWQRLGFRQDVASYVSNGTSRILKRELQSQLDGAASAGADHRVRRGYVRCGTAAAEGLHRRIVQTESILAAVRIGKVGMVENVEELGAELGAEFFPEVPVLGNREIEVSEAGIGKQIARHVSELSQRRRNHNGVALGVAAEGTQRSRGRSRSSTVDGKCLRRARGIRCAGKKWNWGRARFKIGWLAIKTPADGRVRRRTYRQWTRSRGVST